MLLIWLLSINIYGSNNRLDCLTLVDKLSGGEGLLERGGAGVDDQNALAGARHVDLSDIIRGMNNCISAKQLKFDHFF